MNTTITPANITNLQLQGLYVYVFFVSSLTPVEVAMALGNTQMDQTDTFYLATTFQENHPILSLDVGTLSIDTSIQFDTMMPPLASKLVVNTVNTNSLPPPSSLVGYPECTKVIGSSIYVTNLLYLLLSTDTLLTIEISSNFVPANYDQIVASWAGTYSSYTTPKACTINIPALPAFVVNKLQTIFTGATFIPSLE